MAALIVYGSLYPWRFAIPAEGANPLAALFRYFPPRGFNLYVLRDVAVNIAIYVPFGAAAYLAFPPDTHRMLRLVLPVLLGFLLSLAIEVAQGFTPMRDGSFMDVLMNAAGSAMGTPVAAGLMRSPPGRSTRRGKRSDTSARAVLWCWIASLLFPFFPVAGRTELFAKIRQLFQSTNLDWLTIVSSAVSSYVAGQLLRQSGIRSPRAVLLLLLPVVPLQLLIVTRQPTFSLFIGGCIGIVAFAVWSGGAPRAIAATLLLLLTIRGLSPFDWQATATPFTWIPFGGPLEIDWQAGVGILLEKGALYGMAIWGLIWTGLSPIRATLLVSGLLMAIELAQTRLAGRTAEITDPVLALLMGLVLSACRKVERTA